MIFLTNTLVKNVSIFINKHLYLHQKKSLSHLQH